MFSSNFSLSSAVSMVSKESLVSSVIVGIVSKETGAASVGN